VRPTIFTSEESFYQLHHVNSFLTADGRQMVMDLEVYDDFPYNEVRLHLHLNHLISIIASSGDLHNGRGYEQDRTGRVPDQG
jgi:hypothetical protein